MGIDELKKIRENIKKSFKGTRENEHGQTYAHVYSKSLNAVERGILEHGEDGRLVRDVWSQIHYE